MIVCLKMCTFQISKVIKFLERMIVQRKELAVTKFNTGLLTFNTGLLRKTGSIK